MATTPLHVQAGLNARPISIRSVTGAIGAMALLLALPVTVLIQMVLPGSDATVIHLILAVGTVLIGLSAFDFPAARAVRWVAFASAAVLGAIFFAQAVASFTMSETINNIAFSRELGGWGEAISSSLVMLWFMVLAVTGRGLTRWFGVISSGAVIALSVWSILAPPTSTVPEMFRLVFILPIGWYVFTSTRQAPVRS